MVRHKLVHQTVIHASQPVSLSVSHAVSQSRSQLVSPQACLDRGQRAASHLHAPVSGILMARRAAAAVGPFSAAGAGTAAGLPSFSCLRQRSQRARAPRPCFFAAATNDEEQRGWTAAGAAGEKTTARRLERRRPLPPTLPQRRGRRGRRVASFCSIVVRGLAKNAGRVGTRMERSHSQKCRSHRSPQEGSFFKKPREARLATSNGPEHQRGWTCGRHLPKAGPPVGTPRAARWIALASYGRSICQWCRGRRTRGAGPGRLLGRSFCCVFVS